MPPTDHRQATVYPEVAADTFKPTRDELSDYTRREREAFNLAADNCVPALPVSIKMLDVQDPNMIARMCQIMWDPWRSHINRLM